MCALQHFLEALNNHLSIYPLKKWILVRTSMPRNNQQSTKVERSWMKTFEEEIVEVLHKIELQHQSGETTYTTTS